MPDQFQPSTRNVQSAGLPPVTLVLGGARSGKSRFAEELIEQGAPPALYLATAEPRDEEMSARIAAHRTRRGGRWTTTEEPIEIVNILLAETTRPVLVDCLTLWLSNLIGAQRDVGFEIERLLAALPQHKAPVVLVASEVGLGIVPENALARTFRDHAGRLNQGVARLAQRVVFMAAGLPLGLKG
ncbi:MAG TPA: bifunctional adenosylcobinamide kinase/adenosylcobinamide-phosphate guanylyltransferase [Stellaceae bacterium]|jgi:adenosylcobinamide kinase/adenosylcobinamide-phosphate guanylyltransferase|nr:bifunctional adenosylcobinamide kinase/adenosylcobinamide-phosphate guanylyltransferase [Stellaceae bacterium]